MSRQPQPPARVGGPKKVFFHVGAPKTGTTYLQNVLFQNRERLAADGVLFPYDDIAQSLYSMLDFCGTGWGGRGASSFRGQWQAVAARTREWTGETVIVSNELFGGARPDRIEAGLATVQPAEVHVVFTARDLARQLVSDWQEQVKHKHTVTLEMFVGDLIELGHNAPAPFGKLFWGMQDAEYVLERWARFVPVENIHIVTVPQPGAATDALWRRFCAVTELAPEAYDSETKRANTSMGVAETELIRRINFDVKYMAIEVYDPLVRRLLAGDVLVGKSAKLTLPPNRMQWVVDRSRQLVSAIAVAGYDVEGDLEELLPRPSDHLPYVSPTDQIDAELADAAIRAASGLLRHSGRQRRRILELQQTLEDQRSDDADSLDESGLPADRTQSPRGRLHDEYWKARRGAQRLMRRIRSRRSSTRSSQ